MGNKNYENNFGFNSNINGDSYSIHDTFNLNMINKGKNDIDDLRKYKAFFEKQKSGNIIKLIGIFMYIGTIFYLVYSMLKLFKYL